MRNLFVICMMAGYASSALANQQQGDSWSLTTNIGQSFDDNIFRINDDTRLGDGLSRSDWLTSMNLGARWGTTLSRQQLFLAGGVSRQEYANNDGMSNTSHQTTAGWNGVIGPWLHSGLQLSESSQLGSFEDVAAGTRDMRNQRSVDLSFSNPPDRRIQTELRGVARTVRHSSALYEALDVDELGWGATLGYRTARGSQLRLMWQDKQITYRQPTTSGQDNRQLKLTLGWSWPVSDRLDLQGQVGRMVWLYDDRDDKQFMVGSLGVRYALSDKSSFGLRWSRQEAPAGERYESVINNTYSLNWKWQWTPVWSLNQSVSRSEADYQEAAPSSSTLLGNEKTYGYQATLTWHPARNWTSRFSWKWGSRQSQLHSREYDYQNAGVNLSYTF